jgi:hypothetical protein
MSPIIDPKIIDEVKTDAGKASCFVDAVKVKYNLLQSVVNAVVGVWGAIKKAIDNINQHKK